MNKSKKKKSRTEQRELEIQNLLFIVARLDEEVQELKKIDDIYTNCYAN